MLELWVNKNSKARVDLYYNDVYACETLLALIDANLYSSVNYRLSSKSGRMHTSDFNSTDSSD